MILANRIWIVALLVAMVLVALQLSAHAQSAEAEALFREGRALIRQGKLARGCDKLAASERIETSVGTLLNLGDCRERLDRLASAWAAFRKAEAVAKRTGGDDKRMAEAGKRAASLEAMLSKLRIEVAPKIEGLVVTRDGVVVDAAVQGTPVPVDAGTYTVVAVAPGFKPWSSRVIVNHRTTRNVKIPPLEREPAPAPPPPPTMANTAPAATVTVRRRGGTWTASRKVSAVLAIAGAGAIGTGVFFGVEARTLANDADARCPLPSCSDPEALRLNDRAQTDATRANILYAAGGVAVGAAVILWFVGAPGDETVVVPAVGDHQLGMSFAGRF